MTLKVPLMNENFKAFIDSARVIASNEGVKWDILLIPASI